MPKSAKSLSQAEKKAKRDAKQEEKVKLRTERKEQRAALILKQLRADHNIKKKEKEKETGSEEATSMEKAKSQVSDARAQSEQKTRRQQIEDIVACEGARAAQSNPTEEKARISFNHSTYIVPQLRSVLLKVSKQLPSSLSVCPGKITSNMSGAHVERLSVTAQRSDEFDVVKSEISVIGKSEISLVKEKDKDKQTTKTNVECNWKFVLRYGTSAQDLCIRGSLPQLQAVVYTQQHVLTIFESVLLNVGDSSNTTICNEVVRQNETDLLQPHSDINRTLKERAHLKYKAVVHAKHMENQRKQQQVRYTKRVAETVRTLKTKTPNMPKSVAVHAFAEHYIQVFKGISPAK
jgi:hypothetical protein